MLGGNSSISQHFGFPSNPYPIISQRQINISSKLNSQPSTILPLAHYIPKPEKAFKIDSKIIQQQPTVQTSIVKSGAPTIIQTQRTSVVPTLIIPNKVITDELQITNTFLPMTQQTELNYLPVIPQLSTQIVNPMINQSSAVFENSQFNINPPIMSNTMEFPQYHPHLQQDPMMMLRNSAISKLGDQVQIITYQPNNPIIPLQQQHIDMQLDRISRQISQRQSDNLFKKSRLQQIQPSFNQQPNLFQNSSVRASNSLQIKPKGIGLVTQSHAFYHPTIKSTSSVAQQNIRNTQYFNRSSTSSVHPIKDQFYMSKSSSNSPFPCVVQTQVAEPLSTYAKSVSQVPIIPPQTLKIIKNYKQKQKIKKVDNFNYQRGKLLGPYYIPSKHAYYIGEWMNGLPCGYAKVIFDSNSYFEGFFINGEAFCSQGLWIYPDNSYYIGEVFKSQPQGDGQMIYRNFDLVYTGKWSNGKPHGKGIQQFKDGSRYQGLFKNGIKDGLGKFYWADGSIYEGQFKQGFMQGNGFKINANGNKFKGQFVKNMISGKGIYFTNIGQYNGNFLQNKRHGKGVFKYSNGDIFSGQFYNDYANGKGKLFTISGKVIQGQWNNGINTVINNVYDSKNISKISVQSLNNMNISQSQYLAFRTNQLSNLQNIGSF